MARGVRFLLGSRQYPFLKKNGPGIPVFGYCPKNKDKSTSATEERKEDSTQGEYAYFRLARSAGGV